MGKIVYEGPNSNYISKGSILDGQGKGENSIHKRNKNYRVVWRITIVFKQGTRW